MGNYGLKDQKYDVIVFSLSSFFLFYRTLDYLYAHNQRTLLHTTGLDLFALEALTWALLFQRNVKSLIDSKLEKFKNLWEESHFYWGEIDAGTLKFDRVESEVRPFA